jgi:hypothetical protein
VVTAQRGGNDIETAIGKGEGFLLLLSKKLNIRKEIENISFDEKSFIVKTAHSCTL